ncbi:hypothetical protein GMDG_07375 [Pseudogymnoascus destructans 20631-21]|uniref:ADP/ATP carrier protein n=1 Tax=Pseudogymnoascus destructans (strain ATCC MYA-4855 / 20631-21) TaxID=658429 RepID=L8FWW3_PSED2|nr:hypothetical protein GMDG_07375 [Pseudogymnoascus destructans 20631-21]
MPTPSTISRKKTPNSLFHQQHHHHHGSPSNALPALGHAISGSTGTAISNLVTYPLDLIIKRLQVQRIQQSTDSSSEDTYDGILDAAEKIYARDGFAGFFAGAIPDTAKSIADSFLFFLFYNYIRSHRLDAHRSHKLSTLDELAVGVAAGALSKLFTTPLSNIATRAQTSRSATSVQDIADRILKEKGIQGFWGGYSASLVLTLNPSLTFFFFESLKRLLPRSNRDDPGARLTFLPAALSKAAASSITYPFSLAKSRSQVSPAPAGNKSRVELKEEAKSDLHNATHSTKAAKAGRKDHKRAAGSTVFSTVARIYRDEGLEALYVGLGGEVLKGFFSHGITMLVKEQVHGWVIKLYFALMSAYRKVGLGEVKKTDAYERAAEQAKKLAKKKDAYQRAAEKVRGSKTVRETAQPLLDGAVGVGVGVGVGKKVGVGVGKKVEGAKSVVAAKAHSVLDQAVRGTKEQVSGERVGSERVGSERVGRRAFRQDVDSKAAVESEKTRR